MSCAKRHRHPLAFGNNLNGPTFSCVHVQARMNSSFFSRHTLLFVIAASLLLNFVLLLFKRGDYSEPKALRVL